MVASSSRALVLALLTIAPSASLAWAPRLKLSRVQTRFQGFFGDDERAGAVDVSVSESSLDAGNVEEADKAKAAAAEAAKSAVGAPREGHH